MSISLFTLAVTGSIDVPVIDPRLVSHVDVPATDYPSNGPAAHVEQKSTDIAPGMNSPGQQ